MWSKKKKINLLEKSIDNLSNTLEKGNYIEWSYILRKQKRNYSKKFNRRNFSRSRDWNRSYNCYCCINSNIAKNSNTKHTNNWRIYCRYCGNCRKKQIKKRY